MDEIKWQALYIVLLNAKDEIRAEKHVACCLSIDRAVEIVEELRAQRDALKAALRELVYRSGDRWLVAKHGDADVTDVVTVAFGRDS